MGRRAVGQYRLRTVVEDLRGRTKVLRGRRYTGLSADSNLEA